MEKLELEFSENFRKNIKDELSTYKNAPKGHVFIYENEKNGEKKLIHDTNNLIVYRGRSWALLRAFNWEHYASDPSRDYWKDAYLDLFAVGTGGSLTGSPLNPKVVRPSEYGMTVHGSIVDTDNPTSHYLYDSNSYKLIDSTTDIVFYHDTELETGNAEEYALMSADTAQEGPAGSNYKADAFLISKVSITLSQTTANDTGTQNINEIGLYASDLANDSEVPAVLTNLPILFAKATFPTLVKTADRDITFSWFIYF